MTVKPNEKLSDGLPAFARLRLLPWLGPEGKPCYLDTDDNGSMLSRLADATEAVQLQEAEALITYAEGMLADEHTPPHALHSLGCRLTQALRDVSRVAVSRGMRLPVPAHSEEPYEHEESPRSAAESPG
ncbi:hypothetical protein [Streptomyces sp. GC420]|uniref:hypothetical protein n=1 Tax=Streptomyces sp. GC420 TaxID=2697568 RepID=UPI0014151DF2|nr:hypothetical protein [Streptomyces sp. GC420]NBM17488.1 hypothetical protein [Streptomyces sp. GC420]